MKQFEDFFGNAVRFTEERRIHLLETHPEMKHQIKRIENTLQVPEYIVRSKSDPDVLLYYKFFQKTIVGAKYLCVVVKSLQNDYFILTAYFTDAVKKGVILWHKRRK